MAAASASAMHKDSPITKAWEAYKASDPFKNSLEWATRTQSLRQPISSGRTILSDPATQAQREEWATGSLWAAFVAGYAAATATPAAADEKEVRALLRKVESSNITQMGYDALKSECYVQFKDGAVWAYEGVSLKVYDTVRSSPSIGKAFNDHIKIVCKARKIAAAPAKAPA